MSSETDFFKPCAVYYLTAPAKQAQLHVWPDLIIMATFQLDSWLETAQSKQSECYV